MRALFDTMFQEAMESHTHFVTHTGQVYEICRCGATRTRRALGQQEENPWHVCHSCVLPGYRFTINGDVKEVRSHG